MPAANCALLLTTCTELLLQVMEEHVRRSSVDVVANEWQLPSREVQRQLMVAEAAVNKLVQVRSGLNILLNILRPGWAGPGWAGLGWAVVCILALSLSHMDPLLRLVVFPSAA